LVERPQLQWITVRSQVVTPGARRLEQPAPLATQPAIRAGRIVGVEHPFEVAELAAQRIFQPGYVDVAPLREVEPGRTDPLFECLRELEAGGAGLVVELAG